MASRGRRGKGGGGSRLWILAALGCVAIAIGFVAAHLTRDLRQAERQPSAPHAASPSLKSAVETLVGPLDPSGTRVSVDDRDAARRLVAQLEGLARANPDRLRVATAPEEYSRVQVTLRLGRDRYSAEIHWPEAPAAPVARSPSAGGARLALVIDDLGTDLALARSFLDLDDPITPAVIPFLAHSLDVAHLARERGREFLLHLPMEPQSGRKANPGKGALLSGMSEEEIRAGVAEALSSVPGASGVNNHMGSRLTELAAPMGWVMDELRQRNLYFLDSVTSPHTVAVASARSAGIGWARRDVFLDNEQDVQAVGRQLELAMKKAKKNGAAIAIGHPHPATLEALRQWRSRFREAGVEVVPLAELVQRPAG